MSDTFGTAEAIHSYEPTVAGRATSSAGTPKQRAASNHDGYRLLAKLHVPIALTDKERVDVAAWLQRLSRQVESGFGVQNNVKATRWAKGERK